MEKGTLYLCPTPIGNLEDITFRTIRILKEVDLIAAEDTRVTRKLLNHYDIKASLISYHEHNRREKGPEIISMLQEGKSIALVTDAGTPGISDPGEDLVRLAVEAGIAVVPLPGAAAAICALTASGLSCGRFVFEGFLPRKKKERTERLRELSEETRTMVLYEAPHRLTKTLEDLGQALGDRSIAVAREMTKVHEEFFRGAISDAVARFTDTPPRGELVLVIEGRKPSERTKTAAFPADAAPHPENPQNQSPAGAGQDSDNIKRSLKERFEYYTSMGYSRKEALKNAAAEAGISRNEAYDILFR
jgi:16S rRNA (cytidine1402-2'-O)-methyltransferase